MRVHVMRTAAVLAALLVLPSLASAGWETGFNGNTTFNTPAANQTGDGIVNFAVYNNDDDFAELDVFFGGDFGAFLDASTGFGSGASGAQYIYFYQVVNVDPNVTDPDNNRLTDLYVPISSSSGFVVAAGGLDGYVFEDGQLSAVGPAGNRRQGTETAPPSGPAGPGSPVTTDATDPLATPTGLDNLGVAATGDFTDAGFQDDFEYPDGSIRDVFQISFQGIASTATAANPTIPRFTSLLFIASNAPPTFRPGVIEDGLKNQGNLPVATPEPGTMALCALAVPALGLARRRKAKAQA